jgi:hypothetical protein
MSEVVKGLDLGQGVMIDGRLFICPEEVRERLGKLEALAQAIKATDVLSLYRRSIAHDGVYDEDIYHSGRYYAYFVFELLGSSPEEQEKLLTESLSAMVEQFGKEEVLKSFPILIKGRPVTENLTIRPENEDYPSYYSKTRQAYAEKMAAEEVPKAALAYAKEEEEKILNAYAWEVFYAVEGAGKGAGELVELCGDLYLVPKEKLNAVAPYRAIWEALASGDVERYYQIEVVNDGEYPADENNPFGRYYAYMKASLKGAGTEERERLLAQSLGAERLKEIGEERLLDYFPETVEGDAVTKPLTLRPENDDFPSYYIQSKLESGRERARKQILLNASAAILSRLAEKAGSTRKVVVLEAQ